MHDIVLLGINHKTAPVALREKLACEVPEAERATAPLGHIEDIEESLILSTCNRVEFLFVTGNKARASQAVKTHIAEINDIPLEKFENSIYIHEGEAAVRHVFRVTSSLDSMMVGEPQILGQVKAAYHAAASQKTTSVILNRLLHRAFFVAKRVRTETGIGDHAVSISYAAIELSRKIFGVLEGKTVLLVGAGEMAELALEHLIRNRVGNITIANRTFEHGVALAKRFNGKPIRFDEISEALKVVDIIISSTGSSGFVITKDQVKKIIRQRRRRPMFFVDIAVPRDIDPEINRISNSYVYDIDDLKGVINENIQDRLKESVKAERIVDEAVINFNKWYQSLDVVPTVVALRNKLDAIARAECRKTMQGLRHLSENDTAAIQRMTRALINKILHDPTRLMKSDRFHGNKSIYLDVLRRLFNLDDQKK